MKESASVLVDRTHKIVQAVVLWALLTVCAPKGIGDTFGGVT